MIAAQFQEMTITGDDDFGPCSDGNGYHRIVICIAENGRRDWGRRDKCGKPETRSRGAKPADASRLANFSRNRTSSSSDNKAALVNRRISPDPAKSRTRREGPCHSKPETTLFVSTTTRMGGASFSAGGFDFRFDLRLR